MKPVPGALLRFAVLCAAITGLGAAHALLRDDRIQVAFLVENGTYGSELVAPMDVLHHTVFHAQPGMHVFTVARSRAPVRTFEGLEITPDFDYGSSPRIDVLVVPSAERHVRADFRDRDLIAFVQSRAKSASHVMSLCDGAFVLAQAGLLDGRVCTTFPADIPALRERYPAARVQDGVSFVVDGTLITSVGGARSYDPALWLVERLYGENPAREVARGLVIDWRLDRVPHRIAGEPGRGLFAGDRVPAEASAEDAAGEPRRLLDCAGPQDRVLVLCLFGGGDAGGRAHKAGLWCEDSMNEMPLLRHARALYEPRGVRFVGIACPPVEHEEQFGYEKGAFSPGHPRHAQAREAFVAATRRAVENGVIPFETLLFDPSFRLLREPPDGAPSVGCDGCLRAPGELQTYGTPTIWIIGRDGRVLVPALHGNNYEKESELRYTARELEAAIQTALDVASR